jgi:hypothetical protein
VQDAQRVPNRCAFYPQVGPSHPEGFVQSDMLVDDHFSTYVSVVALKEMAEKFPQLGLAPRSELTLAQAENEALKREVEDLKTQLVVADDEFAEAAESTLIRGFGATRVQKPSLEESPPRKRPDKRELDWPISLSTLPRARSSTTRAPGCAERRPRSSSC